MRDFVHKYLAHSANDRGRGVCEPLDIHLRAVAERARAFAAVFGTGEGAFAAGLLHDLGKYSEQFMLRLRDRHERSRDHWTAGAVAAQSCYKHRGTHLAIAIEGHHIGLGQLGDWQLFENMSEVIEKKRNDFKKDPNERYTDNNLKALIDRFKADGFVFPVIASDVISPGGGYAAEMFDVRMLFSALVDADFIETEAHFQGDASTIRRYRDEGPKLDASAGISALDRHVATLPGRSSAPLSDIRRELFDACVAAAGHPPGLFTLSAPTGAGKTLAMLAFALHHARAHGLRRIVLVMPYLNIIDQSSEIYRRIFGAANGFAANTVLEHHSLADDEPAERSGDYDGEQDKAYSERRVLAENWDAPIVLTTSVQCLESMMAHKPSRCRKLHRLAQSVILFDEVQTLPERLAVATLATLSRLADPEGPYRSTVLFATATQPAFDQLDSRVRSISPAGWRPSEIVPSHLMSRMFSIASKRVAVDWRYKTPIEIDNLANDLANLPRVLCIVNLKRHAAELTRLLEERGVSDLLHLSTNMCAAHRLATLDEVRRRLADKASRCMLISTQCVEAGVDFSPSFPVVYRALAPLDSIAQAAGRANRHGELPDGKLVVFQLAPDGKPAYPLGYETLVCATKIFLDNLADERPLNETEIINDPAQMRAYFAWVYRVTGRGGETPTDEESIAKAIEEGDFPKVAELYRLIESDAVNVLVPYDSKVFKQLVGQIEGSDPLTPSELRRWLQAARRHSVSVYRPRGDVDNVLPAINFDRRREADPRESRWFYLLDGNGYAKKTGLDLQRIGLERLWIA